MKRSIRMCVWTSAFAALAAMAAAQPPGGRGGVATGPGMRRGGPAPGGPDRIDVSVAVGDGNAIVRGAPYSAEGVTTVTQTLADGTRIERTTRAKIYRDSEGRVRREQTVSGLAPLNTTGEAQMVRIRDPVAGVTYVLDPVNRTGHKVMAARGGRGRGMPPPPPPPPPGSGDAGAAAPPPPPPPPPAGARGFGGGRARSGNVPNMPESLGTRQIEGVTAVGTRRVETIPTGRIGNDRPIEITDERWESPDLKVVVMSKHHDPRTGDVEYRVTNISRAEPPRDLFTPPADYTITETPTQFRLRQ